MEAVGACGTAVPASAAATRTSRS
eukprot:SAG11_NODE_34741_length_270_cov_0.883041_2_plen_23_part_01